MRLRIQCRACGLPFGAVMATGETELLCPNCAHRMPLDRGRWRPGPPARIEACALCGCQHLFRQRDFPRALGCLLVAVGAALVPWTFGLSLLLLAALDWWLYRRLPEAVVCYRCDTVYRDARPDPRQGPFDLLRHDVLKYGKSWDSVESVDPERAAGG